MFSKFIKKNATGIFASLASVVILISGLYALFNRENQSAKAQAVTPRESAC